MSDLKQRYVSKYCEANEAYYVFEKHDDQFLLLSETVKALNEKDKRIVELERDKDLNKIRADAVREAAEATNKGDEIGYFTCCFHELLSYAEKLEAKGSE